MDYLLIKNGLVVTGNKVFKADVLIGNSKILEISKSVGRPVPGTPVIDAAGRFVLPGGVDTMHHEFPSENSDVEDDARLLSSEVTGGTTCMFENFVPTDPDHIIDSITNKGNLLAVNNMPDFAFHLSTDPLLKKGIVPLHHLFVKKGVSSCIVPSSVFDMGNEAFLTDLLDSVVHMGITLIVELNIPEPVGSGYMVAKKKSGDETNVHLDQLMQLLWRLKDVGFPVLLSKLRFKEELDIFEKFARENKKLFAEIEIPCVLGERNDFVMQGMSMLGGLELGGKLTPITPEKFVELMVNDRILPARPSFRLMIGNTSGSPVFNRPDKYFGLKFFSSMLYTLSVIHGNLAITDFVSCFSTRPAKLMGLYPKKGILREGADADIVIWNPDFERNLYCNFASNSDLHDLKLQGKADFVFVNGKMVYDGETFFRKNLTGRYLYRTPCL